MNGKNTSYNYNLWFLHLGLLETISILYCVDWLEPGDTSQDELFETIVENLVSRYK